MTFFRFYFISILNSTYCSHILQLQYDKCLFIGEAEGIWFHQRNHRNNVRISTDTSCEWKEMFRGCPRAQILNVFADDCVYNTDKSSIKKYAYDHQMYVDSEKMEEVERNLTNERRESQIGTNSIWWNVILTNSQSISLRQGYMNELK